MLADKQARQEISGRAFSSFNPSGRDEKSQRYGKITPQTMARKRKKSVSRPSIIIRLVYLTGRLFRWLIGILLRNARKNPLLASGLSLFMLTFGFVAHNAFFNQSSGHRRVFFKPRHDIAGAAFSGNTVSAGSDTGISGDNKGALIITGDLKTMQKRLADLGLYSGDIDGLSGPRTREAIKKWQQLQNGLMGGRNISAERTDSIGTVIRNHADASVSSIIAEETGPVTKEMIMRVQVALRFLFGNSSVTVNGVIDNATEKAVREFQQMFALPVNGMINHTLTDKMREIGILG